MINLLFVQALDLECDPIYLAACTCSHLVTGVGKLNAATELTQRLVNERPDCVINVGTAGTRTHHVGDILVSTDFTDRDTEPLPALGVTAALHFDLPTLPFTLPSVLQQCHTDHTYTINTGSNFVTTHTTQIADAYDMEAFALAHVCKILQLPFVSIKYITDIIGENSVAHWEAKLEEARGHLATYFKNLSIKTN